MTSPAVWQSILTAIDNLSVTTPAGPSILVKTLVDLWRDGTTPLETAEKCLASIFLGGIENDGADGVRCLLAIPARINALAEALGATYWQTLSKAPAKIVVSKAAHHRIRDVRHQVLLVDLDAWRAWALEHRGAEELTPEELAGFADRLDDLFDRREALTEDLKALKAEIKSSGFDVGRLVDVVKMRRELQRGDDAVVGKWRDGVAMMELYLERLEVE